MALFCAKATVGRIINSSSYQVGLPAAGRPFLNFRPLLAVQRAGIAGNALRETTCKRPRPFPYERKRYTFLRALFDKTTRRFDENSKLIVVEGPVAAGKTEFAKCLASDLGMLHLPEVTMDMLYVNYYNYDLRQLDPELPDSCKSFDVRKFCRNPCHPHAAKFQIQMYMLRFAQYVDALCHIMNTGQGVVLERCAFSDFVFLETMAQSGFISKGARSVYYELRNNTICELMRPHLVIYLDIPVKKVEERLKCRCLPYEDGSKALTTKCLTLLEEIYKQRYLREISTHAELLIYDWSDAGEVEVVVEDIERIDFHRYDKNDSKLKDWRKADEWEWNQARMVYSNKDKLMTYFLVPRFDVPELLIPPEDAAVLHKVIDKAPGMRYEEGFNAAMGDTGILFKW